ncbi:MAG: aminotransferase class V-fold PLP-dependent enzyme [Acidobacteria bacterium]|nr:aminotransferase class V-fold PLP-dependent enzyme [Acidobacteriota bacterium]
MTDWRAIREEFPALRHCTFLNTATFGQLPRRTTEAVARHFARRDEFACADFLDWFNDADAIRALIARLVNCQPEDIAFFPNAATPLGLLAHAIDWRPGDRVLTLEDEFPNHLYVARALPCAAADVVPFERFFDHLTPRTRLVMLSTASYTTGFRPPLELIAAACRASGTILYIDGTQSAGALRFDCAAIQPDMFVVDGYKWLLSPNGAGFAYVHPRVRQWMRPAIIGWRSDRRWREVNALHHGAPEFNSAAERYEGGILSFPSIYGMGASVNLMIGIGPEVIEQRVMALAGYARDGLRTLGARLLSDESPHYDSPIIAARWPHRDSAKLFEELRRRRILVAARHGNLRVSAHFYNLEDDIDTLVRELRELVR